MAQAQRKQDETQQRMQQADRLLMTQLTNGGNPYSQQQAQEIIRLAHQLFTVRSGRPAPAPGNVTLAPTGIQSTINLPDLIKARNYLMEVARRPNDTPGNIMNGMSRNGQGRLVASGSDFLMYSGPSRGPTVRPEEIPAPVRTFVYNVTVDGTNYQVEMNTALPTPRMSSFENSRISQLRGIMSDHPDQILAVTQNGQRVNTQQFQQAYGAAYIAMLRQAMDGQQPDERIRIEQQRRRPG